MTTMDLKKIIAITGKPGLFSVIAQTKNGAIVESLADKKRTQVFTHTQTVSLVEIRIYTETDEMPLPEVFKKMQEKQAELPVPSGKITDKELQAYFASALPEHDKERVYASHIKKVVSWYNMLVSAGITDFSVEEEPAEESPEKENPEDTEEKKTTAGKKPKASEAAPAPEKKTVKKPADKVVAKGTTKSKSTTPKATKKPGGN